MIIELVSLQDKQSARTLGVLEIEEYLFKQRFDTKYLHQVSYLLDACAHHTAVYLVQRMYLSQSSKYYITATAVYLTQRLITACVVVMSSHRLYLSRMNSQRARWVCWKSKNTCLKSGLIRNTFTRYHICLMRVLIMLLQSVTVYRRPIRLPASQLIGSL